MRKHTKARAQKCRKICVIPLSRTQGILLKQRSTQSEQKLGKLT